MTDATLDSASAPADAAAQKPKARGKMIVLLAAALGVMAAGGGAYFFLFASKPAATEKKEEKKVTAFVEIKEMLVGMSPDSAQPSVGPQRFMKLHVMLEVGDAKRVPAIQALQPRIEDLFQVYLRELRPADLQGSAAIFRLKEELLRRVNLAVSPDHVDAVLIKELLLQ